MSNLSSEQAAERLGINGQRFRALASAGRLPAHKIGRVWVIDSDLLPDPAERPGPGRPLSADNAWAILAILAGERAEWVADPSVLSRLRRRCRDSQQLIASLRHGVSRAQILRFRFLPHDLELLSQRADLVRSGLSANDPHINIRSRPDEVDAYIDEKSLDRIVEEFRPIGDPDRPNAVLRIPSRSWVLGRGNPAPSSVVAADLLSHEDARVHRAARHALQRLSQ